MSEYKSNFKKDISAREHQTHHKDSKDYHVVGKKTGAILQQEFWSIVNEMNLQNPKIVEKYNKLKKEILELKDGQAIYESFRIKYGKTKLPP